MFGLGEWLVIEKKCTKCKEVKNTSLFYKRGDGFVSSCKECQTKRHREYAKKNRDKVNAISSRWYHQQKGNSLDYESHIRNYISYNHETGDLNWKRSHANVSEGDVAGSTQKDGRITVRVLDRAMRAHRIAWFLYYDKWPENEVDHINRDPSDNRIKNLREATRKQNSRNRGLTKSNTSGIKGASFHTKKGMWRAVAGLNGKQHHLGYFRTPEEAGSVYEEFCSKHHKDFYYGGSE